MKSTEDPRPLVAHVVYRFDVGGLENGVVNLINHFPAEKYRHAVISLTEISDFRNRIWQPNVGFFSLKKPPGHGFWIYPQLFSLFKKIKPTIVHSRNLAALEVVVPALLAGVPVRIHGEHGRDMVDLDGSNIKYQWLRRAYSPFVTHYITLSRDLDQYLKLQVKVKPGKVSQIYNGVDAERFYPAKSPRRHIVDCPFSDPGLWLIGTVGRMQGVKDQTTLARAFIVMLKSFPGLSGKVRLIMIGEGPLRKKSQAMLDDAGVAHLAWLPGQRDDIPEIMRGLDCFVLPSLGEGISNTILEAMASGLPVVATDVGGNSELVSADQTGLLVPANDPAAMARAIASYACAPQAAQAAGCAGRALVERCFSLAAMTKNYAVLYDDLTNVHALA
ncbi:MAG TPA: TIGR03088 family PEP-CTERM/XrtA system glycosyltransferase [Accumulibacter sp.]|nr:TIGR03088 family PEP-CTERM/XrtA system glycosyltransferase [Accumulibacter sp.]